MTEFDGKVIGQWVEDPERLTPANAALYPHYFMPVGNVTHVDIHDIIDWLGVSSAVGHAIKKLACAGQRGAKSEVQDLNEAIACITRRLEQLKLNGER